MPYEFTGLIIVPSESRWLWLAAAIFVTIYYLFLYTFVTMVYLFCACFGVDSRGSYLEIAMYYQVVSLFTKNLIVALIYC